MHVLVSNTECKQHSTPQGTFNLSVLIQRKYSFTVNYRNRGLLGAGTTSEFIEDEHKIHIQTGWLNCSIQHMRVWDGPVASGLTSLG